MEMILKISAVDPENFARLCAWIDALGGTDRLVKMLDALVRDPIPCIDVIHPTKSDGLFRHNVLAPVVSVLSSKPYQDETRNTRLVVEIKIMTHHKAKDDIETIPRDFLEHVLDLLGVFPR